MREPMQYIRQAIISAIGSQSVSGDVVQVTNRVSKSFNPPYIWVYSVATNEIDNNQQSFTSEVITRVEVVTKYQGDAGGDLVANQLVNTCLTLLRTRTSGYFDLSSNDFKVYGCNVESVNYSQEDTDGGTYFKGIIELSNRVEQLN
jgi:hypothetical protein